ncbi:MAG: carbohydrate kinase family protein [Patescibacteria group bacterium]
MLDVLTVGDGAFDIFIKPAGSNLIKKLNKDYFNFPLGSKINVEEADFAVGGSAANVAVGLSRLGLKSGICGFLGRDEYGREIKKALKHEKVNLEYIDEKSHEKTSFSVIIRENKDRTILVFHGFDNYNTLPLLKSKISEWIYLSPIGENYDDILSKIISLRAEKNVNLAFNPGVRQLQDFRKIMPLLRLVNVLFVNFEEGLKLVDLRGGRPSIKTLLGEIIKKGVKIAVVTKGREGVAVSDGKYFYNAPAYSAERIDVTGAGDGFASGFLASLVYDAKSDEKLAQDELLKRSLWWGSVNSAAVIEEIGAETNLQTLRQVENKVKLAKGLKISEI